MQELLELLHKETLQEDSKKPDNDCIICMEPFKLGDKMTCLPCDPRHCFHTECISIWLARSNGCPMCKAKITKESIKKYKTKTSVHPVLIKQTAIKLIN